MIGGGKIQLAKELVLVQILHGEPQALATEIWGKICPPSDQEAIVQIQDKFPSTCTIYERIGGTPEDYSNLAYAIFTLMIMASRKP